MQIRCQSCHKPFGLGKEAVYAALEQMTADGLLHYDVHCPHCRRTAHVSKADFLRAAPDWGKPKPEEADLAE